jgi:hypothetical protein
MNQTFNSSTDAIIHDSDPRLARFKSVDPVTGDETDLGLSVDLVNAHEPIGIAAPTLGAMTGGGSPMYGNIIIGEFRARIVTQRLNAGALSLTFHFSDASTLGPFTIDYTDIQAVQETAYPYSNETYTLSDDGRLTHQWSIASKAGLNLTGIDWAVITPFGTDGGGAPYNANFNPFSANPSNIAVTIGGYTLAIPNLGGAASGTDTPASPEPITSGTTVIVQSEWTPETIDPMLFDFQMNAARIVSEMNVAQAAAYILGSGGEAPLDMNDGTRLSDMYGFQLFSVRWKPIQSYLPSGGTINLHIILEAGDTEQACFAGDTPKAFDDLSDTTLLMGSGYLGLAPNWRLYLTVPDTVYQTQLMTEAYEIRQRNRWAFVFDILSTPTPHQQEPLKSITTGAVKPGIDTGKVKASPGTGNKNLRIAQGGRAVISDTARCLVEVFGSQGPIDGQWLWTRIPYDSISYDTPNTGSGIGIYVNLQHIGFPPQYYHSAVVSTSNAGGAVTFAPWNYVRLNIQPDPDSESADISGYVIAIRANAREL